MRFQQLALPIAFYLFLATAQGQEAEGTELGRRTLNASYKTQPNAPVKVLFLDGDSNVRIAPSGAPYAMNPNDYHVLPGVVEKMKEYKQKGYLIAIVTNQGGISTGRVTIQSVDSALNNMAKEINSGSSVLVDYYDFAETKSDNDPDRKPNIGMAKRLENQLKKRFGPEARIDLKNSMMVGDAAYMETDIRPDGRKGFDFSNFDRGFANNLGVKHIEPNHFFGWQKFGVERIHKLPESQVMHKIMAPGSCRGRIFLPL